MPVARPFVSPTELLLMGMAIIWGINFSVVKYGTGMIEPLAYNAFRMSIGSAVLLAIAYARPGRRAAAADRWRMMGLGVLGHCVYQILFIEGIALTRAGTASLVVAASPAVVALVARGFGQEQLPARAVAGIALSIGGVLLVVGGSVSADGRAHLIGDLMLLAAVVAFAFYTVGLLPIARRVDSVQIAAWTLAGGVLPLLLIAAPAVMRTDWGAVNLLTWSAILYSGLIAMVVAYLIWYHGVNEIGPTRTAMFANLQPIVAVLVAWAALGEVPTVFQGAGAATVIGGLYLSRR
jgi:drug/metabolite transporter (DMT)-like permease